MEANRLTKWYFVAGIRADHAELAKVSSRDRILPNTICVSRRFPVRRRVSSRHIKEVTGT